MAFQLSPGVLVTEKDLTNVVPAVSASIGALAGNFSWGPALEVKSIGSEVELVKTFGRPTTTTFVDFFSAANFLSYANNLRVVRVVGGDAKNAVTSGDGVLIKNEDNYANSFASGQSESGPWAAKYPGTLGNALKISIADSSTFSSWDYKNDFDSAPGTSDFAANVGGSNDELHIIVIDETGAITGTAETILEKFAFVSKAADAKKNDGGTNYYKNIVNQNSQYVYWINHPTADADDLDGGADWGSTVVGNSFALIDNITSTTWDGGGEIATFTFSNGALDGAGDSEIIDGYAMFANAETIDINLVMASGHGSTVITSLISDIAEVRKDCMVFVSPAQNDVVNQAGSEVSNITSFRNGLTSSSYAVMDSGWKYQYDRYNDTYVWTPLNADVAGLCARTDETNDAWWSPAGLNRGVIKNTIKLAFSPTQSQRDDLYKIGINPVVSFAGQGTILYGDKTLLAKPSAFDRINVRRLFIILEKSIATSAKFQLFEFNDALTRSQFRSTVQSFLSNVQSRRGIYDFKVVCDETNNTGEVIDRNEFVADIYVKPARSINFIQLNFVAVRSSVAFNEVAGA
jgi:hypothetical protein